MTLYSGTFQRSGEAFRIDLLDQHNIYQVIDMQQKIRNQMLDKRWLVTDKASEIEAGLTGGGALFGVFNAKDQLIASRYISKPGEVTADLTSVLDPEVDRSKIFTLETTVVDPAYRGNHLQSLTLDLAMEYIDDRKGQHVLCTVAPLNVFSLKNILRAGLKIRSLQKKYEDKIDGGVWRFVLHKDLHHFDRAPAVFESSRCDNYQKQSELLNLGYQGLALDPVEKRILYAR